MNVIGLNGKFNNLPSIFTCNLKNDLLESVVYFSYQHPFSSLGTENEMVEKVVNRMLFMNIFLIHVDKYSR